MCLLIALILFLQTFVFFNCERLRDNLSCLQIIYLGPLRSDLFEDKSECVPFAQRFQREMRTCNFFSAYRVSLLWLGLRSLPKSVSCVTGSVSQPVFSFPVFVLCWSRSVLLTTLFKFLEEVQTLTLALWFCWCSSSETNSAFFSKAFFFVPHMLNNIWCTCFKNCSV